MPEADEPRRDGAGEPAFVLRGAAVQPAAGHAIFEVDWQVHDRAVTALLGPGGVGKSLLLRTMAERPLPPGLLKRGAWHHRGRALGTGGDAPLGWLPQTQAAPGANGTEPPADAWRAVFDTGAATLLLDEPNAGLDAGAQRALVEALRQHARRGAAVVVTHDISFARQVADHVCLLVAGRIDAAAPAATFFDHPPSELARRFVQQGNCWLPGPSAPSLPGHFHWIKPGRLAGMGRPGLLRDEETDLEAIAAAGVDLLVSLTRRPVPPDRLRGYGIQGRHFPIMDMGVPSVASMARLCREIERALERGACVAVHCHAGLGRTGTLLASYLVWEGAAPDEAIATVRGVCPTYIQSDAQLRFIHRLASQV